jgi:hypothetical protein
VCDSVSDASPSAQAAEDCPSKHFGGQTTTERLAHLDPAVKLIVGCALLPHANFFVSNIGCSGCSAVMYRRETLRGMDCALEAFSHNIIRRTSHVTPRHGFQRIDMHPWGTIVLKQVNGIECASWRRIPLHVALSLISFFMRNPAALFRFSG